MQALDPIEQEQLGQLKNFWHEWGATIITAVLAFILAYAGFQYWEYRKKERVESSVVLFEAIEEKLLAKDISGADALLKSLMAEYSEVQYTSLAALLVARARFNNDPTVTPQMLEEVSWVVSHAQEPWLRDWARLQWMQLLYVQEDFAKVSEIADRRETPAATSVMMEMKGDALLRMGNRQSAKIAYQQAMEADLIVQPFDGNTEKAVNPILRAKIQSLGINP